MEGSKIEKPCHDDEPRMIEIMEVRIRELDGKKTEPQRPEITFL